MPQPQPQPQPAMTQPQSQPAVSQPQPASSSNRWKGSALAFLGMMLVSPDPTILRLAARNGGTRWAMVAGKNVMMVPIFGCFAFVMTRGKCGTVRASMCGPGAKFWALGTFVQACVNIGFPLALIETTAAKALLLISINPLWAALIGRIALKDPLNWITTTAVGVGVVAVLLVFVPSLMPDESSTAVDNGSLHGDLIAILTGVMVATYINLNRYVRQKQPAAQPAMAFVAMSGAFCAACIALPLAAAEWAAPLAGGAPGKTVADGVQPIFYPLVTLAACATSGVIVFAVTLAPRYIPAAEVALVVLLQNIFGPLAVFLVVGEAPSSWTLAGGGLLLATLAAKEVALIASASCAKDSRKAKVEAAVAAPETDKPPPM